MSQPYSSPNNDVMFPCEKDIIIGVGGARHHLGNIWFRARMKELSLDYRQLTKDRKSEFVARIIEKITLDGRKFCKRLSKNKYCIVDLHDKFKDGHEIIHKKIRQRLNISATEAAATTTDNRNSNYRNSNDNCGRYLYFQTMRDNNKHGKLRMCATRAQKDMYRDMLSEAGNVVSQINIGIDPNYQIYFIRGLHEKPHAVEDNSNRETSNQILRKHSCKVIEMRDNEIDGSGIQKVPGEATNYTSRSAILQNLVTKSFPSQVMEELAKYILENGRGNKNRDLGDDSKRIYIGFGQVQKSSERYYREKIPTFNSTHLQQLPPRLRIAIAKVLSFSQTKLQEFSSKTHEENDRSIYVKRKWQQFFDADDVNVDWEFEFVDINIRSFGRLVRHCDYKNDWRLNQDGCAVFSYSVDINGVTYRVVMVMTSRYSIGASFENVYKKKRMAKKTKTKVVKKAMSTLKKQRKKMR